MSLFTTLRDVAKVIQQLDNVDLNRKMVAVQNEAQILFEKNADLKKEVERLKKAFEISGDLFYEGNAYWLGKSGEKKSAPIVPNAGTARSCLSEYPKVQFGSFANVPAARIRFHG